MPYNKKKESKWNTGGRMTVYISECVNTISVREKVVTHGNIHHKTATVHRDRVWRSNEMMENAVSTQRGTGHQPCEEPDAEKLHVRF